MRRRAIRLREHALRQTALRCLPGRNSAIQSHREQAIMINKKFLSFAVLIGAVCAGLGIYAGNVHSTPDTPQSGAVKQLMSKSLPDASGKPHALAQYSNQLLIVNFWATWCKPCVQEMPELSELQNELKSKKVQILGLGIDSSSNIIEFTQKYPVSYPIFVAGLDGSELSRQLGNQAGGLPFTVMLDAQGKLVKTYLGRLKMQELKADIAKYSAEKSK